MCPKDVLVLSTAPSTVYRLNFCLHIRRTGHLLQKQLVGNFICNIWYNLQKSGQMILIYTAILPCTLPLKNEYISIQTGIQLKEKHRTKCKQK